MYVRIAGLTVAILMLASVSHAQQTARDPLATSNGGKCVAPANRYRAKQEELAGIQSKITKLQNAIAALDEGIALQQNIEAEGEYDAKMGAVGGALKLTKATSDTILTLGEKWAPHVKKAYDTLDALVAADQAISGAQATAKGFDSLQNASEAYDEYLKRKKGMVIRPQKAQTPGVVADVIRGTDDLSRGDYAGTMSNMASGVEKLKEYQGKKTKSGLRAGSKLAAAFSDTPGKTDESRVADGLGAMSEVGKLAARAAQERQAFDMAAMAGRAGRMLGYSSIVMEQLPKAKEGVSETVEMYQVYKATEARAAKTQAKFQRQIADKSQEIARLEAEAQRIVNDVSRAEAEISACQNDDEVRLAQRGAANRSPQSDAGQSDNPYQRFQSNRSNGSSRYGQRSRDQITAQILERAVQLQREAEQRATRIEQYQAPARSVPIPTPPPLQGQRPERPRTSAPSAPSERCVSSPGSSCGQR